LKIRSAIAFLIVLGLSACVLPPDLDLERREFPDLAREIFLINGLAETVSVLDPQTLNVYPDVITVGKWPNAILHHNGRLYVTNSGDNSIVMYDESTFEKLGRLYLGKNANPWAVIVKSGTDKGCVPNWLADEAAIVNLADLTVIASVPVGNTPEGGAYAAGKFYVCNTNYTGGIPEFGPGSVSVIDSDSYALLATITVGTNPQSAIAFPSKKEVHVICTGVNGADDGSVVIIDTDTDTVADTLSIGGSPVGSEQGVNWANKIVYLTSDKGLLAYNYETRTIVHDSSNPIDTSKAPADYILGTAFDEVNNRIFVCNFTQDEIIVLDGSTYDPLAESPLSGSDGVQIPVLVAE